MLHSKKIVRDGKLNRRGESENFLSEKQARVALVKDGKVHVVGNHDPVWTEKVFLARGIERKLQFLTYPYKGCLCAELEPRGPRLSDVRIEIFRVV